MFQVLAQFFAVSGAVKQFKTGRGREGEAPAEPPGARTCRGDSSPGGSPSRFFHSSPPEPERGFSAEPCMLPRWYHEG
ncbi:MAG: hypothetical protein DMG05_07805 [Acidobacteria bacterium]|nr:MAG: hypothetical protein DMG05_07805 [Acidobacteriota bacterium]